MKKLLSHRAIQWLLVALLGVGAASGLQALLPAGPGYPQGPLLYGTGSGSVLTALAPAASPQPQHAVPLETANQPPSVSKGPPPLSDRIVEYHMAVSLQAGDKTLSGTESVTWRNPGTRPVGELYLHLYPNAFESDNTTFNRESGGKLRQDERKPGNTGGMRLLSLKTEQGDDLLIRSTFVRPDDGNPDDHTLLKVELPQAVQPGERITLNGEFAVRLPQVFARMGYAGDFVMAGQWFPKLAVYETAGTRGRAEEGWNLHQYHGNSEFYADFGIYDVRITVPSNYTVAATGFPTGGQPAAGDNVKTYHFYADDVHDFAWAASPHFIYYEEPFSAPNVPGVKIKLYLDPKHKDLKSRYMQAAKKALTRYSEWYGVYPYTTLSVVVPPGDGNGGGGMEYPTLVTAWGAADTEPGLELERVVVHEIGHQYWYGMVASNEFEEAWLDEGLTSYAEDKVMEREYAVKPNLPLEASYVTSPAPLKLDAWKYGGHGQYADNVYTRAKLVLNAIERQEGADMMKRIMKSYFQRWKFRHPSTADFQKTVEDVTKKNWSSFFNQYVYGGLMADYAVDGIKARKVSRRGDAEVRYESELVIRRKGGSLDQVPVYIHFEDGTSAEQTVDGRVPETRITLTRPAPADWAMIDPRHTNVLENRPVNNFIKTNIESKWNVRWNVGAVQIIETLFGWVAW